MHTVVYIFLSFSVFCEDGVNSINGIKKTADSVVVVKRFDKEGNVLTHINLAPPLSVVELGLVVNKPLWSWMPTTAWAWLPPTR